MSLLLLLSISPTIWADQEEGAELSVYEEVSSSEDYLEGDPSDDYLDEGPLDDYLEGGSSDDFLEEGPSDDFLEEGSSDDYLEGDPSDDFLEVVPAGGLLGDPLVPVPANAPTLSVSSAITYSNTQDEEYLEVTLTFTATDDSALDAFLLAFASEPELVVITRDGALYERIGSDWIDANRLASASYVSVITISINVYEPCVISIRADYFLQPPTVSEVQFEPRDLYVRKDRVSLIFGNSISTYDIFTGATGLQPASIYSAETRGASGLVYRGLRSGGSINLLVNQNLNTLFTASGLGSLSDFIGIQGNTTIITRKASRSLPITGTGYDSTLRYDLVFNVRCLGDNQTIYEVSVIIIPAELAIMDSAKAPYGVNISELVKSPAFINEYVSLVPSTSFPYDKLVLAGIELFSWDMTPYLPDQYPQPGDSLILNINQDVYDSSFFYVPNHMTFIPVEFIMHEDNRFDMALFYQNIYADDTEAPIATDLDGTLWANSDRLIVRLPDDSSFDQYEYGYKLTIDGEIDPSHEVDDGTIVSTADAMSVYVKDTATGHVMIVHKDALKLDSTKPKLLSMSITPGTTFEANGYLGFPPTDPASPGSLGYPTLTLTFWDIGSGDGPSGVKDYTLSYKGSEVSAASIGGTGPSDTWIIEFELKDVDTIYELSDFSLEITDYAKNVANYANLSLVDSSVTRTPNGFTGVIVDSGNHDAYFESTIEHGGYTSSFQTVTILIDDFTMQILERMGSSTQVATIQTETGSTPILVSDFSGSSTRTGMHEFTKEFEFEGRFSLSIEFTDMLGHTQSRLHPEFIIDQTPPYIDVTFDNDDVRSGNYYNAPRTATIRVLDKNFDPTSTHVDITALNEEGQPATAPSISGWTTGEEGENITTVYFGEELHYSMTVTTTDLAKNSDEEMSRVDISEFIIDMTPPEIVIEGLLNTQAYPRELTPTIIFKDLHFDDYQAQVSFTLANEGRTNVFNWESEYTGVTKTVRIEDLKYEPNYDNVYIMTATITDRAGNTTTEKLMFSVNRFGSTYLISPATMAYLNTYIIAPRDVVVTEINPSGLKNGETVLRLSRNLDWVQTLEEGRSYTVAPGSTAELWSSYVYTIPAASFTSDGFYRVNVRSIDLADNLSENTMDKKNHDRTAKAEINFALDTTKPTCSILGVDDNEIYIASSRDITLRVEDNMGWHYALLIINGQEVKRYDAKDGDISSVFQYALSDSDRAYDIELVVYDRAGHSNSDKKANISIIPNVVVEVVENTVLLNRIIVGAIFGVAAVVALFFIFFFRKKRKDKERIEFARTVGR